MRPLGSFGGFLMALAAGAALAAAGIPLTASAAPLAHQAVTARTLPDFGNPAGRAFVPKVGRAVSTSHPSRVIGTGTPASCTSAKVVRAVARGGTITFNCGPNPVTITMTATAKVVNTSHQVVLDGGGKVTLNGAGKVGIIIVAVLVQMALPLLGHATISKIFRYMAYIFIVFFVVLAVFTFQRVHLSQFHVHPASFAVWTTALVTLTSVGGLGWVGRCSRIATP